MSHREAKNDLAGVAADLRVVIGKLTRKAREQASVGDFTDSQKAALRRLELDGPATVTTLAKAEGVRPQSMGETLAELKAAGLIAGSPDPTDGRQTVLSLTDECRKKVKAARAAKEDWLLRAIQTTFSPAEQMQLAIGVELLKRLADT